MIRGTGGRLSVARPASIVGRARLGRTINGNAVMRVLSVRNRRAHGHVTGDALVVRILRAEIAAMALQTDGDIGAVVAWRVAVRIVTIAAEQLGRAALVTRAGGQSGHWKFRQMVAGRRVREPRSPVTLATDI